MSQKTPQAPTAALEDEALAITHGVIAAIEQNSNGRPPPLGANAIVFMMRDWQRRVLAERAARAPAGNGSTAPPGSRDNHTLLNAAAQQLKTPCLKEPLELLLATLRDQENRIAALERRRPAGATP